MRTGYFIHHPVYHRLAESHPKTGQCLIFFFQLMNQILLGLSVRPFIIRLYPDRYLKMRRSERICTIVISPCLNHDISYFGILHRTGTKCIGHLSRFLNRNAGRKIHLQPDRALIQFRKEIFPYNTT